MKKKIILNKKLAFMYKFSIVAAIVMFLSIFFTPLFSDQEDVVYLWFCVFLALFFIFGTIVLLFPFLVEDPKGIMSPKVKADKYRSTVTSFEQFLSLVEESIENNRFLKIEKRTFENYEMHLYAGPLRRLNLEVVLLLRMDELTNIILEESNKAYIECLESHYRKNIRKISDYITVMTIVCVDRVNSEFRKLMDSNIEQDFDTGRLISGLSFGGKSLYVAKQKGGFAVIRYKKHKKRFFELFGFIIENNSSKTS